MPKDVDDILNEPITADDFTADDMPETSQPEDELDPSITDDDLDIGDDEIDPVGDINLGSSDFDSELEDDSLGLPGEEEPRIIAPEEQVKWTVVPQENGDIWSEHVNGFVLRARPLSAQQGAKTKYMAQLFKDQKMIDKGPIWIENDADPVEYLQNIADRILDRLGLTNVSKMMPQPEAQPVGSSDNLDIDMGDEDILGGEEDLDGDVESDIESDLVDDEDEDLDADLGL